MILDYLVAFFHLLGAILVAIGDSIERWLVA